MLCLSVLSLPPIDSSSSNHEDGKKTLTRDEDGQWFLREFDRKVMEKFYVVAHKMAGKE